MLNNSLKKATSSTRIFIASRVRQLRRRRSWTQAELAASLGISQGYLSKLERGEGSFTAEQFLDVLRIFNVPATEFVRQEADRHLEETQNALARHGATHLWESDERVPSDRLGDVALAVQGALVEGDARLVTAIAPVLVRNADVINLPKLAADLSRAGLQRRLWWVVDSTLRAIDGELSRPQSRVKANRLRRTTIILSRYLDVVRDTEQPKERPIHDILDPLARTKASVARLIAGSSPVAKRWGIVTSIQPRDFTLALRVAHVSD